MKNITLVILCFTVLSCISCEKTGAGSSTNTAAMNNATQQSLIGRWSISKVTVSTYNKNSTSPSTSKSVSSPSKQWEFRSDGNLLVQDGNSSQTLIYRVSSPNKITLINNSEIQELDLKLQSEKIILTEINVMPDGTAHHAELELVKL